tara:strand:+ start:1659 stop:2750 length:1092 start_codon:yes stop_codon:yes gene_type:complete
MSVKIVIVGSTGKLGTKLLNFTNKYSIPIYGATCYRNYKKLNNQKNNYNINKSFVLNNSVERFKFLKLLEEKINILYFLDYGSLSLSYLDHFLKFNKKSVIAIANKEMIIAGGSILQSKINKTKNTFIPLDSEHFSLINSNINKNDIQKVYITASGGPFYFNKNLNLNNVNSKLVLSHPKWKMGKNNLIDSSNFINKILEIYELSYIYNIPLNKINFLISKEAFIHSIVHYNDSSISLNCFLNDMLITLIKPLSLFYTIKPLSFNQSYLNFNNLKIEKPNDDRFLLFKYRKKLLKLSHSQQIKLMIVNNSAHKLYLSNKLQYSNIINYIMNETFNKSDNIKLNNFNSILKFIKFNNEIYNTNV